MLAVIAMGMDAAAVPMGARRPWSVQNSLHARRCTPARRFTRR
jgi:hypothetical protein